jgi:hypothetical protein
MYLLSLLQLHRFFSSKGKGKSKGKGTVTGTGTDLPGTCQEGTEGVQKYCSTHS